MATKKNTKIVIDENTVKQTIKAYSSQIAALRKEQNALFKTTDALGEKIYSLEDMINELNQILRMKKAFTIAAAL